MWIKAPSKYTRIFLQGPFLKFMNLIFSFTKFWSLVRNFADFYLFILGGGGRGGGGVGEGLFSPPDFRECHNLVANSVPFPPSWRQTAPGIFSYFRRPTPTVVDGNTKPQRPFPSRLLFCALSFFVPFTGTTVAAAATTNNAIAPLSHRLLPFLSSR
jgi:hypothetical protein